MHRIILFISLLPILAALMSRMFFADRVLKGARGKTLNTEAHQFAKKMLAVMSGSTGEAIEIQLKKRSWVGAHEVRRGHLTLAPNVASSLSVSAHGKVALSVGLALLAERSPELIARRQWALRFGQVAPVFVTIVAIFALLVAKLSVGYLLAIIAATLGAACCAQVFTVMANLQAANLASVIIEQKRLFPRADDEMAAVAATKAWAWHGIVPGVLARLM